MAIHYQLDWITDGAAVKHSLVPLQRFVNGNRTRPPPATTGNLPSGLLAAGVDANW